MANIVQKAVGAQRLYNAIKQKNAGLVGLFMLSSANDTGTTQSFHTEKVYEAWCAAPDLDVLRMLLNNPKVCRNFAINTRRNSKYFPWAVEETLAGIANGMDNDTPPVDNINLLVGGIELLKVAQFASITESKLFDSDLAANLARLGRTRTWAWGVIERQPELVMQALSHAIVSNAEEYIDLCLDAEKLDRTVVYPNLNRAIVNHERFDVFVRLYNSKAAQQKMMQEYHFLSAINRAKEGHRSFTKLQAAMPWITV